MTGTFAELFDSYFAMGVELVVDSTEALIERTRAPDASLAVRQAAFCLIVERYQDAAYGYALASLGDPHLAWDAAQEAFLTAYCSLAQLRLPEAFPGWLRRIVRTRCRFLQREHAPATASLDALDQLEAGAGIHAGRADSPVDPAMVAERQERRTSIAAAVNALPDGQRLVTVLFYVSGYPQQEIAEFLNVPPSRRHALVDWFAQLAHAMAARWPDATNPPPRLFPAFASPHGR
jgi:RNA polymerase sigma-70 factor (ECF subfamily)